MRCAGVRKTTSHVGCAFERISATVLCQIQFEQLRLRGSLKSDSAFTDAITEPITIELDKNKQTTKLICSSLSTDERHKQRLDPNAESVQQCQSVR